MLHYIALFKITCVVSVGFGFQVPQILVPDNVSVVVTSLVNDLDVVNFTFANTSVCSNFSCSVRCMNAEKFFWIRKYV